jgi:hypothetical protein
VFDDLQQELDKELDARGANLRVRLGEWPLEVRDRNVLRTRLSHAIDAALATGQEQAVPMTGSWVPAPPPPLSRLAR